MTAVLQWLSLAILLTIFGGFAFLFIRHGTKVKADPSGSVGEGYLGGDATGHGSAGGSEGGGSGD